LAFVVFAGQSNTGGAFMNASTLPQAWTPDPLTLIWDTRAKLWVPMQPGVNTGYGEQPNAWGPEVQFARDFRASHPGEVLRIVKVAHGGTGLDRDDGLWVGDWSPNSRGELFDEVTRTVGEARAAAGGLRPDAVFYGQGEEDATNWAKASRYADNLQQLLSAIRGQWMEDPAGKVGLFRINTTAPFSGEVRNAQASVDAADANAASFDANPFARQGDGLHFSAAGYTDIGRGYAALYEGWRGGAQPAPPSPPPPAPPPSPPPPPSTPSASAGQELNGTPGADQLIGGAGADSIGGGDGGDFMRGNDGDDRMAGGGGFDDMHGNQGDDTLAGGDGDDWVVGGKDQDRLYGDEGDDVVLGNLGHDLVDGGAGADILRGGQGDDVVFGWSGADWISGDRGADTLSGGSGADVFHSFADAGHDLVTDFSYAEGDRVNLIAGSQYSVSQAGADVVVDIAGGARLVLQNVQLGSLGQGWLFVG
jgi:Ca2+-binding RTX toxin-like protein